MFRFRLSIAETVYHNGYRYDLPTVRMSRPQAAAYCQSLSSELAKIKSSAENALEFIEQAGPRLTN